MSLGSAGLGLALLRAMNAGLGFLLNIGLAAVFGISREMDALFVAMAVAVFLARDLARVIRTAAVPCLVEEDEGRGEPGFSDTFQWAIVIIAAGITLFVWIGAPLIVKVMSPGFDPIAAFEAQRLLRLLAPSLFLFMLFGSAQSAFHAQRQFLVPELGETLWRVIAIASLFTLGRQKGIEAYATSLTVAAFSQWALLFIAGLRKGLPLLPLKWTPLHPILLKPFWLGAAVVLFTVIQMQIEGILDRVVLSFMAPGSIAIFSYSSRLALMMPVLLSTSLLMPWLPEIARIRAQAGDSRHLAKQGSLFLAAFGALLAIIIVWAARNMVEVLLLHGKFEAASAETVSHSVQLLALGIPAIFCIQCLGGLYIVERDLKAIIRMGLVAVLAHATGNLLLRIFGVPGIALSGSLTAWIVAGYLWWKLRTLEPVWFPWRRFTAGITSAGVILFAMPWTSILPWVPIRMATGAILAGAAFTVIMWPATRRMQAYERAATTPAHPPEGMPADRKIPNP